MFTEAAERLGKVTGLIQRQRRLSASSFAQTLVFQWIARPKATMETMARHLQITPQGLRQRLGPKAQAFLRALLAEALTNAWQARSERLGLLDRFKAVIVEDCSVVSLPAELADQFPGCGGTDGAGAAALKIDIRWNLLSGELCHLSVHAGRTSDKALAATAADLPEGGLHLADQGFFNSERWLAFGPGKHWISRVPAGTKVCWQGLWQPLGVLLATLRGPVFDQPVTLVQKTQLPCRLVALRCPEEVANRRKQKLQEYTRRKKGRDASAEQLRMCEWTVFATNVPVEKLAAKEVWLVYRCRWQIELLFKRAKQQLGWGFSWGTTPERILVELYAKLLGLVVTHWATLLRGGPLAGISSAKLFTVVAEWALPLCASMLHGVTAVQETLRTLSQHLDRVRPQTESHSKPSTRQNMLRAELAA